jgi:predicted DNA-binding transcriptional regulator YafY
VTLEDIAEEFVCSERTAQRMTVALQAAFPQTDHSIGEDRRARWTIPARAIAPLLTPSSDELVALAEAIAQLDHAGMGQAARARSLERKVRALIPPEQGTRLDVDREPFGSSRPCRSTRSAARRHRGGR